MVLHCHLDRHQQSDGKHTFELKILLIYSVTYLQGRPFSTFYPRVYVVYRRVYILLLLLYLLLYLLLLLYVFLSLTQLPRQQGSHTRMQVDILPRQQGQGVYIIR
jgi:hypothetical protein